MKRNTLLVCGILGFGLVVLFSIIWAVSAFTGPSEDVVKASGEGLVLPSDAAAEPVLTQQASQASAAPSGSAPSGPEPLSAPQAAPEPERAFATDRELASGIDPAEFPPANGPANTLQAAPQAAPVSSQPLVADYLLVDKSERLLIAYREGRPIRAYRGIQFGDAPKGHKRFQGDERTPEGRYTINGRNPQSRFHLSLRISYPNANDRAYAGQRGRSPGGDIFIHGQPNHLPIGRIGGDWTDGCIALSNREIEELWQMVPNGTPIDIRP